MSDKLVEAIDRLEKTISDLKGTVTELVGDMQIVRMKQAMMADRIRKVSIKIRDREQPQDQHGPSIPAQDVMASIGARAVQQRLSETLAGKVHAPAGTLEMPRCTNCKHSYRAPFSPWKCTNPLVAERNHVDGLIAPTGCFNARLTDGPCGPNGRYFERKDK